MSSITLFREHHCQRKRLISYHALSNTATQRAALLIGAIIIIVDAHAVAAVSIAAVVVAPFAPPG